MINEETIKRVGDIIKSYNEFPFAANQAIILLKELKEDAESLDIKTLRAINELLEIYGDKKFSHKDKKSTTPTSRPAKKEKENIIIKREKLF